ncbi:MAG TPA: hypothetical protein VK982_00360 [Bacteroidales bacterium]|nr:hypothetical protein [Bacteroidales bacterium]
MTRKELIAARDHIWEVSNGQPNYTNSAALRVIDEKLKDLTILDWISKNRESLIDFIELESEGFNGMKLMERNQELNHEIKLFKKTMAGKSVSHTAPFIRLYSFVR